MVAQKRKRGSIPLPSGDLSVWDILADEVANKLGPRPENSVTTEEFAARMALSGPRARQILSAKAEGPDAALSRVQYRTPGHRPGICYVPVKK